MDTHSREEHPEPRRLSDEPEFRRLIDIARRMNAGRYKSLQAVLCEMAEGSIASPFYVRVECPSFQSSH